MPRDFILLVILLGVVVPWRGTVQIRKLLRQPDVPTTDRLSIYVSTILFEWFLAGITLWRCAARGVPPGDLGLVLPRPRRIVIVAVVLSAALVAQQLISLRRLARLPADLQGFAGKLARALLPQGTADSWLFAAVAATAALCEEFLYRGFLLHVFAASHLFLAGIVGSSLLFAAAHIYQGPRGVVATFGVGLLFAVVRVGTGSLVPTATAHFLVDLSAGLAAPRMLCPACVSVLSSAGPPGPRDDHIIDEELK